MQNNGSLLKRKEIIICLILLLGLGSYFLFARAKFAIPVIETATFKKNQPTLATVISRAMVNAQGTYSIVIKNLKTQEVYYLNEKKVFETGSLYKLWLLASVCQRIQEGELSEDEMLSGDIAALNQEFDLAPNEAELKTGTIAMTIGEALNQMITISHNYAAMLLTKKVGLSSLAAFLQENNFNNSAIGNGDHRPVSTAFDIALFYEKLYNGQLANQKYTQKMINLLKNQKLNNGLPKYLPDKTKVANKTGDIGWFKHDSGIVFTDQDYIIVILSESNYPAGAQERIAQVSKAVYDYFTRQN